MTSLMQMPVVVPVPVPCAEMEGEPEADFDCHKRGREFENSGRPIESEKFTASRVVLLVVFIEDTALVGS